MSTWLGFLLAISWAASAPSASLLNVQNSNQLLLAQQALEACKNTSCPQLGNLQLQLGVLHWAQTDIPQALELLKAAASSPSLSPSLRPFAYAYLAQTYAHTEEIPAALLFFEKALKEAPTWLRPQLQLRVAEMQFAHRLYAKSLQTLGEKPSKNPEVLALWARNRLSMKQYDKALTPLGQLAVEFPTHPHGLWAEELLSAPPFSQPPLSKLPDALRSPAQRLLRAQNLVQGGAPQEALKELERLPAKLGPAETAEAAFWQARVYFAQGKPELATPHITLALKGGAKVAQQASWLMARRHMRSQENELARQWLTKAASKGVAKLSEEARFMSAWLWLNESKWKEAETALGEFADTYPHSSFAVDARWFQGWAQFRQNHCEKARQTWQGAADAYPKSPLLPQFQYWALRCAPQNNEAEKAALQQALSQLAGRFPGSLYGRMAKERLQSVEALFPALPPPPPASPLPPELALAHLLAQTGLWAEAQKELEALKKRTRGAEDTLRLGASLQNLGAYDVAYALAARHLWGAAFTRKESQALSLLFPKAFEDEVLAASENHLLPPALIWAVMRRESAFAVSALSSANARGLMQIIPPTGKEIAKQLGTTLSSPEELFAPPLNISFGSWYLRQLLNRFGHMAPAIAAYNAGPKAVLRWLSARGQLPLDEWVEEIPFRETRNYVKQVLPDVYAFTEMYVELTEIPPPAWEWTLPEPQVEGVDF